MDQTQDQHERATGDEFVVWLNKETQSSFVFSSRGTPVPDLIYTDGTRVLGLEISSAYYDGAHAKFQWENARGKSDAPSQWSGMNFETRLIQNISQVIKQKSQMTYGPDCCLVIFVRPNLTYYHEFIDLLQSLVLPSIVPFTGVYILGYFPEGQYVIPIKAA